MFVTMLIEVDYLMQEEFAKSWKSENQFNSKMSEADRQKKLSGWKDAVSRTLTNK